MSETTENKSTETEDKPVETTEVEKPVEHTEAEKTTSAPAPNVAPTTPEKQLVHPNKMIKVRNKIRHTFDLHANDGNSVTLPPRYKGTIPAKFLTWNKPSTKIIAIEESLYE